MPRKKNEQPNLVRLSGMGFEFGAAVIGCTLVGYWIGGHYEADRMGSIIGAVLGIVGGGYNFLKAALRASATTMGSDSHSNSSSEDEKGDP